MLIILIISLLPMNFQNRYKTLDGGWEIDPSCKTYEDLPQKAKDFIKIIEIVSDIPVKYLGIGPSNDDLIIREDI